jgi:hypothetical protein
MRRGAPRKRRSGRPRRCTCRLSGEDRSESASAAARRRRPPASVGEDRRSKPGSPLQPGGRASTVPGAIASAKLRMLRRSSEPPLLIFDSQSTSSMMWRGSVLTLPIWRAYSRSLAADRLLCARSAISSLKPMIVFGGARPVTHFGKELGFRLAGEREFGGGGAGPPLAAPVPHHPAEIGRVAREEGNSAPGRASGTQRSHHACAWTQTRGANLAVESSPPWVGSGGTSTTRGSSIRFY